MQYAQVAVKTKTQKIDQVFTYTIPPQFLPQMQPGIVVEVSFRGRKLPGVVLELKRHSNQIIKYKLKPIAKIIDPSPILDNVHLELARWISEYYLSPIGEVIFSMVPPVAHRLVKPVSEMPSKKAVTKLSGKKGIIYTLYDRIDDRLNHYLKLIKKVLTAKKQIIILFPEIKLGSNIITRFPKEFNQKKVALLHTNLTKSQRYQVWNEILESKKQIIIGSRSAIFAPCRNLGLIIIDQNNDFSYKEEQTPRYNAVTVAKQLSKLFPAPLVLGSLIPTVENFYWEKRGKIKKIKNQRSKIKNIEIDIVDSRNDKGIISWKLEQEIGDTLKNHGRVILFVNQKGMAQALICQDCGYIFRCSKCDKAFTYFQDPLPYLFCHDCGNKQKTPVVCPKCRGVKIKEVGYGIQSVAKIIGKLFPEAKVVTFDKESTIQKPVLSAGRSKINNADIIIGTQKILEYPDLQTDLQGIINLDFALNLPEIFTTENIFHTIVELINITKKKLIIQTFNPDQKIFNFLTSGKYQGFLSSELDDRKKYLYPPFSHLIKIICQNTTLDLCQKNLNLINKNLQNLLKQNKIKAEILGPSPCFLAKKRNRFRWQIIIKSQDSRIKKIISQLKLSRDIIIDVDPIFLL